MSEFIKAYKGFDKDLKCRGFQYEIGKEFEEEKASLCNKGFHACLHPLDVLDYYPPTENNRYCVVEIDDNGERQSGDTKVCGTKIKVGAEIGIKGLISATFEYVKERCTSTKQGEDNTALTGGDSSALTGGNWSALTGGYSSALTGGDSSALTGGEFSVVYGGEYARVRAKKGSVLALQYWVDGEFKGIKFKEVDGVKIKEDTYYTLVNGRFKEVKESE